MRHMRDLFVTMVVLGSLHMILYRPYIGVLMWSWIGYMNQHRLSWGFANNFPFVMIVAVTSLMAIMFLRDVKRGAGGGGAGGGGRGGRGGGRAAAGAGH